MLIVTPITIIVAITTVKFISITITTAISKLFITKTIAIIHIILMPIIVTYIAPTITIPTC